MARDIDVTTWPEYAAIPAVNWSTLREMRRSPLHYQWRLRNPRPDTKATALGRAVHAAVFEAFRFSGEFVVYTGRMRRGRDWDAFKDMHAAETILTANEYATACAIRDALDAHPLVQPYRQSGLGEHTIRWTDAETGIECKARIDWISQSVPAICDLKTTRDAAERRFANQVAAMGWHGQMAWYRDGWLAATGEALPAVLIAVESEAPHDVAVFELDDDSLYNGEETYRELLRRVAECRAADAWPGQYETEQTLRLPTWAWPDEDATSTEDLGLDTTGLTGASDEQ